MIIAVDDSMVDYTVKYMLASNDQDEINYISNRIKEAVPQMQLTVLIWLMQRLNDYMVQSLKDDSSDYFKNKTVSDLYTVLEDKRKEFVE